MYTGIVQGAFEAVEVHRKPDFMSFAVQFPPELLEDLGPGTSVNIDGVCQTVTCLSDGEFEVHAIAETLRVTTLGEVQVGDRLNLETALGAGDPLAGTSCRATSTVRRASWPSSRAASRRPIVSKPIRRSCASSCPRAAWRSTGSA